MGSETTPEMLAMASRIADQDYDSKSEPHEWRIAYEASLSAIKERSEFEREQAAQLIEDAIPAGMISYKIIEKLPTALRNGEHYHDR